MLFAGREFGTAVLVGVCTTVYAGLVRIGSYHDVAERREKGCIPPERDVFLPQCCVRVLPLDAYSARVPDATAVSMNHLRPKSSHAENYGSELVGPASRLLSIVRRICCK